MAYLNTLFGGTRRFFYSKTPESKTLTVWGNTAQTLDRVLHPIGAAIGAPAYNMIPNARAAMGQSERPTKMIKGAHIKVAAPPFALTVEAWDRFISSIFGQDDKSTVEAGCIKHAFTWTREPTPFTVEEHQNGAVSTAFAYRYKGVWVNRLTIDVDASEPYARITPELILSVDDTGNVNDRSAIDIEDNWPNSNFIPPTKCKLVIAPCGSGLASVFDGTFNSPTGQGVFAHDLSGASEIGHYASSYQIVLESGVDLMQCLRGGFSSGAGNNYGKPYGTLRVARVSINYDVVNATIIRAIMNYQRSNADATQLGWTIQFGFTGDGALGATTFESGSLVINAAVPMAPADIGTIDGPVTSSLTFECMQPADDALDNKDALAVAVGFDDIDTDYA